MRNTKSIKPVIFIMTFAVMLSFFSVKTSYAAADPNSPSGNVEFSLTAEQDVMSSYLAATNNGDVYVFVKNLSDEKIYRYPLKKDKEYKGEFSIPFGAYTFVPDPNGSSFTVSGENFAITEETTRPVACALVLGAKTYTSETVTQTNENGYYGDKAESDAVSKQATTAFTPANANKEVGEEEDAGFKWTFGKIVTGAALLAILVIFIYNKIKHIRHGGSFYDD